MAAGRTAHSALVRSLVGLWTVLSDLRCAVSGARERSDASRAVHVRCMSYSRTGPPSQVGHVNRETETKQGRSNLSTDTAVLTPHTQSEIR